MHHLVQSSAGVTAVTCATTFSNASVIVAIRCLAGDERRRYLWFDRLPYLLDAALIRARMEVKVGFGVGTRVGMVVLTFAPLRHV